VFVEGGIYHGFNRFASGEAVFTDPEEARNSVEFLRLEDQAFARRYEGLDAVMIPRVQPATEESDEP